jgi:hypothetical protein
MATRREFLKLGALFVPAAAVAAIAPRVAYIWAKRSRLRVYDPSECTFLFNGIPIEDDSEAFVTIYRHDDEDDASLKRRITRSLYPDLSKLLITGTIKI